jgi:hypothetical protein
MLRVYIFPFAEEVRNRLGGMKRGGDTMRWRVIVLAGVICRRFLPWHALRENATESMELEPIPYQAV